jgi:signal transduction histidine kinase
VGVIRAPVYADWGEGVSQVWPDEDSEHKLRPFRAFFAAFAHDLKNPLTGLGLWADMLQLLEPRLAAAGGDQDVALFHTALEQINALVRRSECVVDDLLEISRLEAGHSLQLATAEVDLVALVKGVLRARPDAGHVMRLESSHSRLRGRWDADRLGEYWRTFSSTRSSTALSTSRLRFTSPNALYWAEDLLCWPSRTTE